MLYIATGAHDWENMLVDGIWTYSLDMIWEWHFRLLQQMAQDAKEKYGVTIKKLYNRYFGMMHGYLPLTRRIICLCISTWRNTITGEVIQRAY